MLCICGWVREKEEPEKKRSNSVYKLRDFLPNPDVPKMVQYREPFLYGTLREVGFGKSFAYKHYYSVFLGFLFFTTLKQSIRSGKTW